MEFKMKKARKAASKCLSIETAQSLKVNIKRWTKIFKIVYRPFQKSKSILNFPETAVLLSQ
jgi:hypothetical protein